MSLLNTLPDYVLTTKTDELINWMRKSSIWYMLFGLACCAIELMHTGGPRADIDRFGASPRASARRTAALAGPGTAAACGNGGSGPRRGATQKNTNSATANTHQPKP